MRQDEVSGACSQRHVISISEVYQHRLEELTPPNYHLPSPTVAAGH